MTDQPIIAEFSDYRGLVRALNAARELRDINFDTMDAIAGTPKGYFSKTLGPGAARRVTMESLSLAFGALGIRCVVLTDEEQLKRIESRLKSRNPGAVRNGTIQFSLSRKFLKKIAKKGGDARFEKLRTSGRLVSHQKHAISIRWERVKAAAAKGAAKRVAKATISSNGDCA